MDAWVIRTAIYSMRNVGTCDVGVPTRSDNVRESLLRSVTAILASMHVASTVAAVEDQVATSDRHFPRGACLATEKYKRETDRN